MSSDLLLVLKDLYAAISKLQEVGRFRFHIIPYPISLRASEVFLTDLGFSQMEVDWIDGFLKFVKETQGREFEEILAEGALIQCARKSDRLQPGA
jgi:hypothetical protein